MSSESSERMRDEYDFRPGQGTRGKYYERYTQHMSFTLLSQVHPPFVAATTSSATPVGEITKPDAYPFHPKIQIQLGNLLASVHAS